MDKTIVKHFLILVALLGITALALVYTVDVKLSDQPGVIMTLPDELGDWVGNRLRFCHNKECYESSPTHGDYFVRDLALEEICPDCGEDLFDMSWVEYDALPKDTEFVKSSYTNELGESVFVSIVLSGRERNSIHRPQRCLVGQGNALLGEYSMEVPIAGKKPMKVRVIQTSKKYKTVDGPKVHYGYYAYWFVGQDRQTDSHYARMFWLGWDRVVRSVAHRWAYIAISGQREEEGTDYEEQIINFVQQLCPKILTDTMKEKYGY